MMMLAMMFVTYAIASLINDWVLLNAQAGATRKARWIVGVVGVLAVLLMADLCRQVWAETVTEAELQTAWGQNIELTTKSIRAHTEVLGRLVRKCTAE
jgi:hypothetical protein